MNPPHGTEAKRSKLDFPPGQQSKKVLITQSNYIPWKGYFDAINRADVVVLYDEMQYTRRDWRNRNKIKTPNGLFWLSIPVKVKGKYHQKINETRISDPDWNQRHWKTIRGAYRKAAFFSEYEEFFANLYDDLEEDHLSEINLRFLRALSDLLGIETPLLRSKDLEIRGDRTEKLLHLCQDLGATHYLSGPAAKGYLDTELFREAGLTVEWVDYTGYPAYRQLHGDFEHGVSIIDLVLNEGPRATQFMKSFSHGSPGTAHQPKG